MSQFLLELNHRIIIYPTMPEDFILILAAFLTSTLSAIIGMGGGITLLGIMAIVMPDGFLVVAYHGIVQLVSNATRTYVFRFHIDRAILVRYSTGLFLGLFLSIVFILLLIYSFNVDSASELTIEFLKPLIGIYILWFLFFRKKGAGVKDSAFHIMGVLSGLVTVFVGAAGPLIAPLFIANKLTKEVIIATKAACQALGHFLKIPIFYFLFDVSYVSDWKVILPLVISVYIGTNFGKIMLGRLSESLFKKIFRLTLTLIAIRLLLSSFY